MFGYSRVRELLSASTSGTRAQQPPSNPRYSRGEPVGTRALFLSYSRVAMSSRPAGHDRSLARQCYSHEYLDVLGVLAEHDQLAIGHLAYRRTSTSGARSLPCSHRCQTPSPPWASPSGCST